MRVIFVTREGYDLSGARVRCYNFARELVRHGIDARVFSFADHLGAKCGEDELRMSAFEKVRFNFRALRPLVQLGDDAIFVLQRINYHILAPLLISFFRKNKIILDCDDWNIRENPVYYLGFYPSSKMEYVTRLLARRVGACLVASDFLRSYLMDFNPRTHCIPTGVDTNLFSPCKGHGDSKVIFSWIGTAYHKEMGENINFIMSCFSVIADQYDNVTLSLAGQGRYFDEIRKGVACYKHKDKVTFHAWIPPDKIPEYLANIDVGLLPLIQDTKFNKAKSPTKLFEYMSMAKATISSDIGEAKHIIRDRKTGLLVRNRDEFISGMRLLIDNPHLRQFMGSNAREVAERKYSLQVLGESLADIIRHI